MSNKILLLIVILITIVLNSCNKGSEPTSSEQDQNNTTTATVSPNGGNINIQNINIIIPPSASTRNINISVTKDSNVPVPLDINDGVYDKNSTYKIVISGDTLNQPLRITMPYSPSLISTGFTESDLVVIHFTQNGWEFIQGTVDAINKKITFESKSFSSFAAGISKHKVEFPSVYTQLDKVIDFNNNVVPSTQIQSYDYSRSFLTKNYYWGTMQAPAIIDPSGVYGNVVYSARYMDKSINTALDCKLGVQSCLVFKLDLSDVNACTLEFNANSKGLGHGSFTVEISNSENAITNSVDYWKPIKEKYSNKLEIMGSGAWEQLAFELPAFFFLNNNELIQVLGSQTSKNIYLRIRFYSFLKGTFPTNHGPFIDNILFKTNKYSNPPNEPSNPHPIDLSFNQAPTSLSWECNDPDNDPLTYDVYFGTTNPPTNKVSSAQTAKSYTISNLSVMKDYFWKIIASDNHSKTSTSPVWRFKTGDKPVSPSLASPLNNAVNIIVPPTLSWNESSGAISYTLQVSTNSSFSSFVYNQSGITSISQQVSGLTNSTTYYWRVNATNIFGSSDWKSPWKFTTINLPPNEPSNPYPLINAAINANIIGFSWDCSDPEGDPLTYDLYFGITEALTGKVNTSPITNKNYNIGNLQYNTKYYWKIVAMDDHNNSTSGAKWYFTTSSGGTAPSAPTLLFPSNSAINQSTSPTLSWNASTGATSYNLQVANDNSFSNSSLIVNENVGNNTSRQLSGLNNSKTYFWKVAGVNSFGTSVWSDVWNFTTSSLIGNVIFFDDFTGNSLDMNKWEITEMTGGSNYTVENGYIKLLANSSGVHWITIKSIQQFSYPIVIEYRLSVPGNRNWIITGIEAPGPYFTSGNENTDSKTVTYGKISSTDFPNAIDSTFHIIQIIWNDAQNVTFKDLTTNVEKSIFDTSDTRGTKLTFRAGDIYTKNNQVYLDYVKVYCK